jgi:general secretion pathway protein D
VFKLRYLSAAASSKTVRGFVSRGAAVLVENVGNSIVVTDSRANIDKVARILALTDIPYFRDIHWRLIPLKEADASELNREISQILKSGGLFNRAGVNRGSYAVVPIKSLNALLVVSKWPEIISLVEKWSSALDHSDNGKGSGVFVYFVQVI